MMRQIRYFSGNHVDKFLEIINSFNVPWTQVCQHPWSKLGSTSGFQETNRRSIGGVEQLAKSSENIWKCLNIPLRSQEFLYLLRLNYRKDFSPYTFGHLKSAWHKFLNNLKQEISPDVVVIAMLYWKCLWHHHLCFNVCKFEVYLSVYDHLRIFATKMPWLRCIFPLRKRTWIFNQRISFSEGD